MVKSFLFSLFSLIVSTNAYDFDNLELIISDTCPLNDDSVNSNPQINEDEDVTFIRTEFLNK
jgi:hypothetical protein